MNTVQAIVDELEDAGLFLVDHMVGNLGEHELYFTTSGGYAIEDVDLDEAYDIASMYAAVNVYEAYHQGEDVIVVDVTL